MWFDRFSICAEVCVICRPCFRPSLTLPALTDGYFFKYGGGPGSLVGFFFNSAISTSMALFNC